MKTYRTPGFSGIKLSYVPAEVTATILRNTAMRVVAVVKISKISGGRIAIYEMITPLSKPQMSLQMFMRLLMEKIYKGFLFMRRDKQKFNYRATVADLARGSRGRQSLRRRTGLTALTI
ncbi:hypothetical protein EVAR_24973_1 [Eumeta japonica]|uniref:Uncharacterized protein n=1 Tax=Eumeta variegata TaxID=151549 RepID=A0A4C1ZMN1_EUMVA|nr:hypothetical protein EVAR_24973_1 [Eumeta japonica]